MKTSAVPCLFALCLGLHSACTPAPATEGDGGPVDEGEPASCVPLTCEEAELDCGVALDGCGGRMLCGECAEGETCGGGGANRCGEGSCEATSCALLGASCGLLSDGCADVLACGTCEGGESCSSENVCCTPTATCASEGAECGVIDDGCGRQLACGACGAGETCGGGGPNVCGEGSCEALSCDDVGALCGAPSNGCGETLSCGTCGGGMSCGGGDVPYQCGAACANDCPSGYACDDAGFCAGSSVSGVVLDFDPPDLVVISGTVTANGGDVPLRPGNTSGCVYLTFTSLEALPSANDYACSDSGWAYSVELFAGSYKITASDGGGAAVPGTGFVVSESTSFTSTGTRDLDFDPPDLVVISGTVTANGGDVPLRPGDTSGCVYLTFTSLDGLPSATDYACTDSGWSYSVELFAGSYRITVIDGGGSALPSTDVVVSESTSFTSTGTRDLDIDPPALLIVSGTVKANGGDVPLRPGDTSGCVYLTFTSLDGLPSATDYACTDNGWAYGVELFAGSYKITASDGGGAAVPSTGVVVSESTSFTSTGTRHLDFDPPALVVISGTVTANGGDVPLRPGDTSGCVYLTFTSLDGLPSVNDYACSDSGWSYSVELFAGNYRITAIDGGGAAVPSTGVVVSESASFTSTGARDLDIDPPTLLVVSGIVKANGGDVPLRPGDTSGCVYLTFTSLEGLPSANDYACSENGWAYSVELFAGSYLITAFDGGGAAVPSTGVVVSESASFTSTGTRDLDFDPPALLVVSGTVQANGGDVPLRPGDTSGCVYLTFTSLEGLPSANDYACSENGWAYSVELFAGSYKITASDGGGVAVPNSGVVVTERIRFQ